MTDIGATIIDIKDSSDNTVGFPYISFPISYVSPPSNALPVVHLPDGSAYQIEGNSLGYTLYGYGESGDMSISIGNVTIPGTEIQSHYQLSYADGLTDYFSYSGRLLYRIDRFGNRISFEYSFVNGYPQITITDTLDRVTVISGSNSFHGHTMTVALPNNISLVYEVRHLTNNIWAVSSATDACGNTTHYSYIVQSGYLGPANLDTSTQFINLKTVTHPTNAQTEFSYTRKTRYTSSGFDTDVYKLSSRKDIIGTDEYNAVDYTYSSNDCTGSGYAQWEYTYFTTATDALGVATTSTFNEKHVMTDRTVKLDGDYYRSDTYTYNSGLINTYKTVLVLKTPKTESSIRKVFMPKAVAEMLIAWKESQDEAIALLGQEYRNYNLVFAGSLGLPTEGSTITGSLKRLIKENNLPPVVFHSFRHASITYKLKLNGGDIKAVQGDSGHSQVKMVTDIYSHILDDDRKNNAQLFQEAFYDNHFKEKDEQEPVALPDAVTPEALAKMLSNPEIAALLAALAKQL